jgi:hypothetical protein
MSLAEVAGRISQAWILAAVQSAFIPALVGVNTPRVRALIPKVAMRAQPPSLEQSSKLLLIVCANYQNTTPLQKSNIHTVYRFGAPTRRESQEAGDEERCRVPVGRAERTGADTPRRSRRDSLGPWHLPRHGPLRWPRRDFRRNWSLSYTARVLLAQRDLVVEAVFHTDRSSRMRRSHARRATLNKRVHCGRCTLVP